MQVACKLSVSLSQVVITTHFGDVFDYGLLTEAYLCELAFYQMEVMLEHGRLPDGSAVNASDDAPLDWEQVTPMFRLIPGKSSSSFGIACAQQAGLPTPMLRRAMDVTEHFKKREPVPVATDIV